jgi:hypothetical protein
MGLARPDYRKADSFGRAGTAMVVVQGLASGTKTAAAVSHSQHKCKGTKGVPLRAFAFSFVPFLRYSSSSASTPTGTGGAPAGTTSPSGAGGGGS